MVSSAAGVALGGCGSTTKIIEQHTVTKTVTRMVTVKHTIKVQVKAAAQTTGAQTTTAPPATVYVLNPFTQALGQKPSSFTLAQDGSVGITAITWSDWGSSTTTGSGTASYRKWPSQKYGQGQGTITLTGLRSCNGRLYYTAYTAQVPSTTISDPTPTVRSFSLPIAPSGCS